MINLKKALTVLSVIFLQNVYAGNIVTLSAMDGNADQLIAEKVIREIYAKAGIPVTIVKSLPHVGNAFSPTGKIDGEVARSSIYGFDKPNLIRINPPYIYISATAFGKTKLIADIKKQEDLRDFSIGLVDGTQYDLMPDITLSKIVLVGTYRNLYSGLVTDMYDIAIDTTYNGTYSIKKYGFSDIDIKGKTVIIGLHHYLISSNKNKKIAKLISDAIKSMHASGELNLIVNKYRHELEAEFK